MSGVFPLCEHCIVPFAIKQKRPLIKARKDLENAVASHGKMEAELEEGRAQLQKLREDIRPTGKLEDIAEDGLPDRKKQKRKGEVTRIVRGWPL